MDKANVSAHDRQAIENVIHRFYWLVDRGRAAETAALFSANARITFGPGSPSPGTIEGDAIPGAMQARQAQSNVTTRHVLSNICMTANDDGTVACDSLLTLFRSDSEVRDTIPATVADIVEILVNEDGDWKIRERTVLPIFNRSAPA